MSLNLVIWLAALAWLLYRQVQRRPIGRRSLVAVVLLLVGAVQFVAFAGHHRFSASSIAILCLSFLIGAGLGIARGFTIRLWVEHGQLLRQGTAITVSLWLVAVGLHLTSEQLIRRAGGPSDAGSASMLLYLALSLTIQTQVLRHRACRTPTALRAERAATAS